jgi:hypothetical protein
METKNLKDELLYVYTLVSGSIPEQVKPIIKWNEEICDKAGVPFKIIPYTVDPGECAAGKSDWERIRICSETPRVMYVDWDVKILKFPDFDPLVPMMAEWGTGKDTYDSWAIYNGDRTDIFKKVIENYKGKKGEFGSYYKTINSKEFSCLWKGIKEFQHIGFKTGRKYRSIKVIQ